MSENQLEVENRPFTHTFRKGFIRPILKRLIYIGFKLLADIEVKGYENIPSEGPLLIVGNHFSFLDPVLMINIMPMPLEFIGGTELPGAPPALRIFPRLWGTFKVHRGSVSRQALNDAEKVLSRGRALCIFPEAGSWAKVLRPARPGAALLAVRTKTAILPVGLSGVHDVFPIRLGRRAKVKVEIGKPIGPFQAQINNRADREMLDNLGHEMMRAIKKLIPAAQHGYYSDDPELRLAAKGTEIYPWENNSEK